MMPEAACIGYVRRSKKADERVVSLEVQRAEAERYARERGWAMAGWVEDDGVSGGNRRRFDRIDAAVKASGARYVVAYHIDRAARDAFGCGLWLEGLAKRGVELHVVGKGRVDIGEPDGYLANGVEMLVAGHYRMLVGKKTRDALGHLREQGRRWNCNAPYGTRWSDDGRAVPDKAEQAVIARARRLRDRGATVRGVVEALNAGGLRNRYGRPFTLPSVFYMLSGSAR